LNTVHVPAAAFGPAIADLLIGVIERNPDLPTEILLPFELKIRQPA
jgi:DNA-binding LacI/PurR family transcriptional regulator